MPGFNNTILFIYSFAEVLFNNYNLKDAYGLDVQRSNKYSLH